MIERGTSGGTVITGPHVTLFQMMAQRGAMSLEAKGLKMSRGRSVYAAVKQQYGFKGNRESVMAQLDAAIQKFKEEHPANE